MGLNTNGASVGPIDMNSVLEWTYDKVVNGVPGLGTAEELAANYRFSADSPEEAAHALIRWQVAKAAASGFMTGLGGLLTLPVAVPANIASVLYVQIRTIAAIACLGGWDLRDDRVKSLIYLTLVSKSAAEVGKSMAIKTGERLAMVALRRIPGRVLIQINKKVGFRLLTKFGEKGIINLGKAIPLVGGVLGGSIDGYFTKQVGAVAMDVFIRNQP